LCDAQKHPNQMGVGALEVDGVVNAHTLFDRSQSLFDLSGGDGAWNARAIYKE